MGVRPRRARKAPWGARVVRIAVPAVAAGTLAASVAATAWPSSAGSPAPAPVAAPVSAAAVAPVSGAPSPLDLSAAGLRSLRVDRGSRDAARPSATVAEEKALVIAAAREKAAKAEASAAAKAEAAKKAADRKKAEKAADRKKAEAAKKAAARKKAEAARKAEAAKQAETPDLTVVGSRYTTAAVKLRSKPAKDSRSVDVVAEAEKVKITETVRGGYRLVVVDGKGRWVTNEYLSRKKPRSSAASGGISDASCGKSSGIESGLVANGKKVYRAICAAFPEVSSFGGRRASNDFHGSGQAVDAMISDSAAGRRLADWVRANASRLGVSEVIYAQRIWTVQRSGEGWRGMSDRGSATANHYDHVHVSVY